jgi:hypothetical protein
MKNLFTYEEFLNEGSTKVDGINIIDTKYVVAHNFKKPSGKGVWKWSFYSDGGDSVKTPIMDYEKAKKWAADWAKFKKEPWVYLLP